jgi:hypothetical protein
VYFDTLTMLRQLLVGVPPEMVGALVSGLLGQSPSTSAPAPTSATTAAPAGR